LYFGLFLNMIKYSAVKETRLFLIISSFLLMFCLNVVLFTVIILIAPDKNILAKKNDVNENLIFDVIFICFIAPLIETFVFQKILFNLIHEYLKKVFPSIVITSFLFGVMHYDSVSHVIATFIICVVLCLCYNKSLKISEKYAFWNTFIVHSLWNIFSFIIRLI